MEQSIQEAWTAIVAILTTYGLSVLGAIATLILGWVFAGWAYRAVDRGLRRLRQVDATLRGFLASLVRYLVLIVTIVAVLNQFGVETTSLIAVLGAAGLAIGLALQGTLSNVAAGVMIMFFRPFRVGDYVEAGGTAGTVESVTLFVTLLNTPDNVHIFAPNAQIWGNPIKNYSHNDTRRLDLVVGIAYEDEIDKAMAVARELVTDETRVLNDPEPLIVVSELADSSVNLTVRFWCRRGDYWDLKFQLTKALKEAFDRAGITIPYPQRSVHMVRALSEA